MDEERVAARFLRCETEGVPRDTAVLYFAAVSLDGRRSSTWRVWTGKSNKPSDDLYAAPRSQAGRLKVSIHKDGRCQYGPMELVRRDLRPGDRHALDRWELAPPAPDEWIPLLVVEFPHAELRPATVPLGRDVRQAPSGGDGTAQRVTISARGCDADRLTRPDVITLGRLRQPRGTEIVVAADTVEFDRRTLYRPDGKIETPWWQLPPSSGGDRGRLVLLGVDHHTRTRWFTETSTDDVAPTTLSIDGYDGEVRLWSDRPNGGARQNDFRFCAMLRVSPDWKPTLYVDTRARCNFDSLGATAGRLIAEARTTGFDGGWDRLHDDSWVTGLATARVLAADIDEGRGMRRPEDPRGAY